MLFFNECRKEMFLEHYKENHAETGIDIAKTLFSRSYSYEMKYLRDLSSLNPSVAKELLTVEFGVATASKRNVLIVLRQYLSWCEENEYNVTYSIEEVLPDMKKGISDKMVASPVHLQKRLMEVFDPPEEESLDIIYQGFFWLAFSGIRAADAELITTDEVFLDSLAIIHDGHHYPLYIESIPAISRAISLKAFWYTHPHYAEKALKKRAEGNRLLKSFARSDNNEGEDRKIHTLSSTLSTKIKNKDFKLNYTTVYKSGVFYRAKLQEDMFGVTPSLVEHFLRCPNEKLSSRGYYNKKKLLTDDYILWKQTFADMI